MRIVIAMDSFKDSLSAVKACEIVAQSLRSLVQEAEIVVKLWPTAEKIQPGP